MDFEYLHGQAAYSATHLNKEIPKIIDSLAEWTFSNLESIPSHSPPREDFFPSNPYDEPSHPFYQPPRGIDEPDDAYLARLKKIMLEDRARKREGRNHLKHNLPRPDGKKTDMEEVLAWMQALCEEQWGRMIENKRLILKNRNKDLIVNTQTEEEIANETLLLAQVGKTRTTGVPPLRLGWRPTSVPASQMRSFYPEETDVEALDADPNADDNPLPSAWVCGNADSLPQLPGKLALQTTNFGNSTKHICNRRV